MDESGDVVIDVDYEFSAPKWFDFIEGESDEQIRDAQLWFDTNLTYAPSPFMYKVKATRTVQLDSLCDFGVAETSQKEAVPSESTSSSNTIKNVTLEPEKQIAKIEHEPAENKENVISKEAKDEHTESIHSEACVDEKTKDVTVEHIQTAKSTHLSQGTEACTPKPPVASQKNKNTLQTESKKQQTARKIASAVKNPSVLKSKSKQQISQPKGSKTPATVRRDASQVNKVGATSNLALENQAIKRQKLDGGKTRQILNVKPQILPHKARPGVVNGGNSNLVTPSNDKSRKKYVREPASASVPFVSMAEMMKKFQSGTRNMNLPPRPSSASQGGESSQVMQRKPKLTLTRPTEPAFQTSQRVRSVKLKSSAELEEEMMAKIPKFKARPVNRKFSAPKWFDFIEGESEDQIRDAQLWFDTNLTYAPSPFMYKVKATRTVQLDSLCDFGVAETSQKEAVTSESTSSSDTIKNVTLEPEKQIAKIEHDPAENKENVISKEAKDEHSESIHSEACVDEKTKDVTVEHIQTAKSTHLSQGTEACTPKPPVASQKNKNMLQTESKKQQTARKIASAVKNPSVLKSKSKQQISQPKGSKTPATVRRDASQVNKVGATSNLALENQAIKRQKLDGGKTRQILNVKPQILPHKARPGVVNGGNSNLVTPSNDKSRKKYVREPASASVPFVSMAEMMKKFQSGTRNMNLPPRPSSASQGGESSQVMQRKPKLTLTRPTEPAFQTSQRVRSVKLKSSAELEEEMMAKIPKFKARPVNRKILEAPTLPAMKRSTPQVPEFQEFHLETMERANQNAETSTVASTEALPPIHQWKPRLTTPKTPPLQTLLRARPPTMKSTEELEKEELENAPKFKARPLNKKIFESKGELGLFCNKKRQVTVPQEFHFATDERIPPPTASVTDLFDKLSLCSDSHNPKPIPRNTAPNPFHLHTEERGAEKEKRFVMEIIHKQIEDEQARIPKATPYPYTTDYPVAQPILKEDPIPVPEKVRRPLTEVQEFDLHVVSRAADRAEFDKKIKEKEMMYKRYRDEAESAKMMEEEKALKQLRRTLVPHARPVPNFNKPFLPRKSSKGVTKPRSPRLKIIERTERRKMVVAAATSSAASNMR
ncbi:hypothetical protein CTI12_AA216930 [Artemisia annua]|uniref:Targeting protein for XKLP2 n=1 Tax=Artemisia annua TaxID=35608 RepID=A0A2U1NX86_ARTAN|nr:hypothetical protein CTI12_AA216930 [Artemisia annua]